MADPVVKRFLAYEHEVMFRILHNRGGVSISTIEPGVLQAAEALAREGYVAQEGEPWPCAGRIYHRFVLVPERVTMDYLKDHL